MFELSMATGHRATRRVRATGAVRRSDRPVRGVFGQAAGVDTYGPAPATPRRATAEPRAWSGPNDPIPDACPFRARGQARRAQHPVAHALSAGVSATVPGQPRTPREPTTHRGRFSRSIYRPNGTVMRCARTVVTAVELVEQLPEPAARRADVVLAHPLSDAGLERRASLVDASSDLCWPPGRPGGWPVVA